MIKMSLGKQIAQLRKKKGMTQEQLADLLGVSAQAVSKWENDISCPDIMLLPKLSELLGISIDLLLGKEEAPAAVVPEAERKPFEQLMMKVRVLTQNGDRIRVTLPMTLIRAALEIGVSIPYIKGMEYLQELDLTQLLRLVDSGLIGKLVEVETGTGDVIHVTVE